MAFKVSVAASSLLESLSRLERLRKLEDPEAQKATGLTGPILHVVKSASFRQAVLGGAGCETHSAPAAPGSARPCWDGFGDTADLSNHTLASSSGLLTGALARARVYSLAR